MIAVAAKILPYKAQFINKLTFLTTLLKKTAFLRLYFRYQKILRTLPIITEDGICPYQTNTCISKIHIFCLGNFVLLWIQQA